MQVSRRAVLGAGAAGAAVLVAGCQPNAAQESARLSALLERVATDILRQSPEGATALGVTEERAGGRFIDRLGDNSREGTQQYVSLLQQALTDLRDIRRDALSTGDQVTYDVVQTSFDDQLADLAFNVGNGASLPYRITQLTGSYNGYSGHPSFLDSSHPLTTADEAEAYLTRLAAYATQLDNDTQIMAEDVAAGVIPPDFLVDAALSQARGFAAGGRSGTVLTQTLVRRLPETQGLTDAQRADIISRAEGIMDAQVLPAYQRMIDGLASVRQRATHDAGVWHVPRGEEMYAAALVSRTTTQMSADEIHNLGLEIIAQTQSEMDTILRAEGMTRGSVAERIEALSRRPDQLYPNTDAGREQLLRDLNVQVEEITALMPRVSTVLAQAQMEIQRVPVYVEAGAPGGYYQGAALDGSRPGIYYINLRDTREWPRFSLPTLSYHEGVPGHHWQGAIQQESAGTIPFIRSALLGFGAYSEGWGLYAEQLADELGVYANNRLGRLGYLQSMTFRASRLVVDTGMHSKRWTREQAIQSMMEATGDLESSVTTEIERYCAWPGQACSYMVGKVAILRMREQAQQSMGDRYDPAGFHDTMLTSGAAPLSVLERIMAEWAARPQAS